MTKAEHMNITVDWLKSENACGEAVMWTESWLNGSKPLAECINRMDRADWLIWLLWHSKAVNIRQLVHLAVIGPKRVLKYAGSATEESQKAIAATEAWVKCPTEAAGWAVGAAEAAGLAAGAAGWASVAVVWAAEAAGWAAEAAGRASVAAGLAAEAAGRAAEHKVICDLIRAELKEDSFKALEWPVKSRDKGADHVGASKFIG